MRTAFTRWLASVPASAACRSLCGETTGWVTGQGLGQSSSGLQRPPTGVCLLSSRRARRCPRQSGALSPHQRCDQISKGRLEVVVLVLPLVGVLWLGQQGVGFSLCI